MKINKLIAKSIKDSRGSNTIEVSVNEEKVSAPSGKSTGLYETHPYKNSLDWNINTINSMKLDLELNSFEDLKKIEDYLCKEFKLKDVKEFGANALFALECASLKALAKHKKIDLWQIINPTSKKIPVPVGNVIGGGLHSHTKNKPVFQEFLLIPQEGSIKNNFLKMKEIHSLLRSKLNLPNLNDEGALESDLDEESILNLLKNFDVPIGMDVAASSFYKNKNYIYNNSSKEREDQINFINKLIKKYSLLYIEDPLEEEDFEGFSKIDRSEKNLVVGDDLTATQISRLKKAIKEHSINAMIIKPNQNGSLIELKEIFEICRINKIKTIISHRSGETLDNSIADLAVGFQSDYIKSGIATKWRETKLLRLIEIEKEYKK